MDEAAKKKALRMITYGLYVAGSKRGEEVAAATVNWLTQASFAPPLVVLAAKRDSALHAMIRESGVFSISVLAEGQKELAQHFFKHRTGEGGTLGGVPFETRATGAPILKDALAFWECRVVDAVERGDHTIFVGEVVEAGVHREGEPLTLAETGFYYGG